MENFLRNESANRQIVVATNSPHLISIETIKAGAFIYRIGRSHNQTYAYALDDSARNNLISLVERDALFPHHFGYDAKQIFFQEDAVIVVEGQEDAILLPQVFQQVGLEVGGWIYGWGSGGAGNIQKVCAVLKSLGLRNVACVLDGDQKAKAAKLTKVYQNYLTVFLPENDIRDKLSVPGRPKKVGILNSSLNLKPMHAKRMKEICEELNARTSGS